MSHRLRIRCRVSVLVLVGCSAAMLPPGRAYAHTEPMHAVATLLARHYLSLPDTPDNPRAVDSVATARLRDALRQIEAVEVGAVKVAPYLKTERYRLLGVEEKDHQGNSVSLRPDEAPMREDPGLSGYGHGAAEFPRRRPGALLGFLVANVDTYQDTWVSAKSPYQYVEQSIEDELSACGTDNDILQAACGLVALPFAFGNAFARASQKCAVSPLSFVTDLISCAQGIRKAGSDVAGALIAIAPGAFAEMAAEDHISGCYGSDIMAGMVVDALIAKEKATASITPGYDGVSRDEERALRDDSPFYLRHGIGQERCDAEEEYLGNIEKFVTPGRPLTSQGLILSTRARFLDFMLSPASASGVYFGVNPGDRRIAKHFRALEPWFWSAEASKLKPNAGPAELPDYKRWRMESFTMVNHFMNVLGHDGKRLAPALKLGIEGMKTLPTTAGEAHRFGGLSLAYGKRFLPTAQVRGTAGLEPGRRDEVSVDAARTLRAEVEPTSHYVTLRRRVCPPGEGPSLPTRDGLPATDCSVAVPKSTGGSIIERNTNAPADLGALDGFDQWMNAGPDAALLAFGHTHPHFASHSPFVRDLGRDLRNMSSCETSACRETGAGIPYAREYQRFSDRAPRDHGDAMRLRGLALALHMIQDLTVPHHIASTVAYSHQYYEEFFAEYVYPLLPNASTTRYFYTQPVILGTAGGTDNYDFPDPRHIDNKTDGLVTKPLADPDLLFDAVATGMQNSNTWELVDREFLQLRALMAKLATDSCPASKFSTRRLAWATAYRTAELIEAASRTIGRDVSGAGYDRFKSEIDPVGFWVASSIPESGRTEPRPFSFPSLIHRGPEGWSLALKRVWTTNDTFDADDREAASAGKTIRRSIAMPTWKPLAEASFPLLIATTAHLFLGAGEARANSETTCDGGIYRVRASLPASFPVPSLEAESCSSRIETNVAACFSDPTTGCGELAGIPSVMACAKSAAAGRSALGCTNLADVVARCSCDAGVEKTASNVSACVGLELFQQEIRELTGSRRITDRTAVQQYRVAFGGLMGQPRPDQDGDGIDDDEDQCKNQPPHTLGRIPNTTLSNEVCLLGDACPYGCLASSSSIR